MPISFACSRCGQAYSVSDRQAGKRGKCKLCGSPLTVPVAGSQPEPLDLFERDESRFSRSAETTMGRIGAAKGGAGRGWSLWLVGLGGVAVGVLAATLAGGLWRPGPPQTAAGKRAEAQTGPGPQPAGPIKESRKTALQTSTPARSSAATVSADADVIITSIGLTLKRIPAGSFVMGEVRSQAMAGEFPQHQVTITRPFSLGVNEVTQREYLRLMGQNPSKFRESELQPVEQVTWFQAVAFCNRLSEREGRKPYYRIEGDTDRRPPQVDVTILGGSGFRLPTEAEWEYACRAGSQTKYPFPIRVDNLGDHAWYEENSSKKTHPVGQKLPNGFGIHDMIGNVCEWCGDFYDPEYFKSSPAMDPTGPAAAPDRVVRSSSFVSNPFLCRSACRFSAPPSRMVYTFGFRVAADAEGAGLNAPTAARSTPALTRTPAAARTTSLPPRSAAVDTLLNDLRQAGNGRLADELTREIKQSHDQVESYRKANPQRRRPRDRGSRRRRGVG